MKINRTVETTLQHVSSVCSYCAASEVPVAMWFGKATLGSNSWLGKASCFFPNNRFGKPCFFLAPLYSVQSACLQAVFLKGVPGKTPATQTIRKMKKCNINRYIYIQRK